MTHPDLLAAGGTLGSLADEPSLERIRALRPERRNQYHEVRSALFPAAEIRRVAEVQFVPQAHVWDAGTPQFRIAVVVGGGGWFITARLRQPMRPGSFFSRVPGESHDILTGSQGLHIIIVSSEGHRSLALHSRYLGDWSCVVPLDQADTRARFRRLLEDAVAGGDAAAQMAGLHCELILHSLAHLRSPSAHDDGRARATFRRCRRSIDERAKVLRGIGEAASACAVDAAYLGRLFKRFEGISPKDYLARIKMGHACELLLSTDLSVYEIAEELAYNDPFTFSRAFKRVMGCSPSAYRA